jgi:beta-galactosidase/beta-glucuronidase
MHRFLFGFLCTDRLPCYFLQLLIQVSADCSALPSVLPRVGLGMALRQTNAVRNVTWRGLGPHENYPVIYTHRTYYDT